MNLPPLRDLLEQVSRGTLQAADAEGRLLEYFGRCRSKIWVLPASITIGRSGRGFPRSSLVQARLRPTLPPSPLASSAGAIPSS